MESCSTLETTGSPVLTTTTTTTKKKEKKKKKSSQQHQHVESWPRKKKGVTLEASYVEFEPPTTTNGCGSSTTTTTDHASSSSTTTDSCGGCHVVVGRTRSLTDDDLEELKGCLDLGFGFSYHEIPELCSTLPALELCYSMSQRFLDDQLQMSPPPAHHFSSSSAPPPPPPPPLANWKFSSPGDDPEEVKARLKYWAQAVACTVRLCS